MDEHSGGKRVRRWTSTVGEVESEEVNEHSGGRERARRGEGEEREGEERRGRREKRKKKEGEEREGEEREGEKTQ